MRVSAVSQGASNAPRYPLGTVCRVVIVEDNRSLANALKRKLMMHTANRDVNFDIKIIEEFQLCLESIDKRETDIYIIDINLPRVTGNIPVDDLGIDLIKAAYAVGSAVIVYADPSVDRVFGEIIEYGADDYIEKPDSNNVVVDKVAALWRRVLTVRNQSMYPTRGHGSQFLINGDWIFQVGKLVVQHNNREDVKEISFTEHEFLRCLLLSHSKSMDKDEFQVHVLRYTEGVVSRERAFETIIYSIRKKFGRDSLVRASDGQYKIIALPC